MTELEQYYNEIFKKYFDPEFENLTDIQKKNLENSLSFAIWKFNKACSKLGYAVKDEIKRTQLYSKLQSTFRKISAKQLH